MIRMSFPAITTRQSFVDEVEVVDADDGTSVDLTGCTIKVQIATRYPFGAPLYTMPPYYDAFPYASPLLLASTDDGTITIPDVGVFVFSFTESQIASLCPGIYQVGCTIARDAEVAQLLLGDLPVLDGVVPQ